MAYPWRCDHRIGGIINTATDIKRLTTILLAAIVAGLAGLVVLVLVYQQVQRVRVEPPLSYDQLAYSPERADLCPGQMLVYTNTLTISRPAIITSYLSWFRGRGGSARPVFGAPSGTAPPRVFTEPVTIGPIRRENEVPSLPVGEYEFHFGATDGISLPAIHTVLFSVRARCP